MLHSQRTQETYNFNFGVEYQFPHEFVLSAGYVGSRGLFLPLGVLDLNQLAVGRDRGKWRLVVRRYLQIPSCVDGAEHLGADPAGHECQRRLRRRCRCG